MKRILQLCLLALLLSCAAHAWGGCARAQCGDLVSMMKGGIAEPVNDAPAFTKEQGECVSFRTAFSDCNAIVDDVVARPPHQLSSQAAWAESPSRSFDPSREPLGRAPPFPNFSN